MSSNARPQAASRPAIGLRTIVSSALVLALLVAMALDTTVVGIGSEQDVQADVFSPEKFGAERFPGIRSSVETRAVEATTLAAAIAADKNAAAKQYGVGTGVGPVLPVKFLGVVGEGKSGVYRIAVEGLPPELTLRVQTGPAINGTDLRDATGEIAFGQFVNQIEYQNAGAALNNAMKAEVLAGVDTAGLPGKTVSVVGVFKLINPKSWLVTPVRLGVE